jgi:hypothetical protein
MSGPDADDLQDDRAQQAVAHLQRATLEFIEAARAVLDIAEEAVREPGGVMTVLTETLGGLAEAVAAVAPGWVERGRHGYGSEGRSDGTGNGDDADRPAEGAADDDDRPRPAAQVPRRRPDRPGVEHIRIS